MNINGGVCRFLALAILAVSCGRAAENSLTREDSPASVSAPADSGATDPYLWLEDVAADRALDWVRARNAVTTAELQALPTFGPLRDRLRTILDSKERIPYVAKHGAAFYNFWRDDEHVRGLWRRASLEEYRKPTPAWETVLDLDALGATENENWVWHGANVLYPSHDRALVQLSRGGSDAVVVREFDLLTKSFVADGFVLPEAKSDVDWLDRDTLYVGTDFGPDSLTTSGYPRIVKQWRRGTPLAEAATVFAGEPTDVDVNARVNHDHGHVYEFIRQAPTFFTTHLQLRRGDAWVAVDKPDDATLSTFDDQFLLHLKTDWEVGGQTYRAGSLLAAPVEAYLAGRRDFAVLFAPTPRRSLSRLTATKNYLITTELENVRSRINVWRHADGAWTSTPLATPDFGAVAIDGIDPDESDDYFLTVTDFLTPTTLLMGTLGGEDHRMELKGLPAFFDASGLEIQQQEATSRDGTRVPYFLVGRKDRKSDGSNPTLLYGYGGFEISLLPGYSAQVGAAWLETGGVFVIANIRGGGEFGPAWHRAARREHRQLAFDDFIAVAEDLIARGVTSPRHLGIQGGSNGGLLVGAVFTQRPELFHAVVCQVPLLDMRRFNHLLAGASWMDEYGNPDVPEDWAFIRRYSPYQNVVAERQYPRVLFLTSTRDDRVHPGHARKMVARMQEQGHDVLYYENIEGGHGGAANNAQKAFMDSLIYTFLTEQLR